MSSDKKPKPSKPTIGQTPGQYEESSVDIGKITARKPSQKPNSSKKGK